jgi:molybdopterin converting factor small subunit
MNVQIQFFSYFRELTGITELTRDLPAGTTLGQLHDLLCAVYPSLQEMCRSTLLAVGVDYQPREYVLSDGDVVSFFPPVQGG